MRKFTFFSKRPCFFVYRFRYPDNSAWSVIYTFAKLQTRLQTFQKTTKNVSPSISAVSRTVLNSYITLTKLKVLRIWQCLKKKAF